MEYKVVESSRYLDFKRKIEEEMGFDWKPLGGVSVANVGINTYYYQAMVRE